jgi:hypothetical protein
MKKITAVIETYYQTGPNTFKDIKFSKNFTVDTRINEILMWAAEMGIKNPTINDVKLCAFYED